MTGTPGGKDFAKLVLGSIRNKLLVGRRFAHEADALETWLPVARAAAAGGARVLVALIPQPKEWPGASAEVRLWELWSQGWEPRTSPLPSPPGAAPPAVRSIPVTAQSDLGAKKPSPDRPICA